MKIGHLTNGISCEYRMQEKMREWLSDKGYPFVYEFNVGQVGRIADFLVKKQGNGLINIEAKCNNLRCMMDQLKDHSKYCNYCFAFIPDYAMTPEWFKDELAESGFGLIIFNYENDTITEVFEAHVNKDINKQINRDIGQMVTLSYKKRINADLNNHKQLKIEMD